MNASGLRTRRLWWPALCVVALALASCAPRPGQVHVEDSLRWAGFAKHDGLRVTRFKEDDGIDRMVRFILRGPASAVDRTLVAAGFTTPSADADGDLTLVPLSGFRVSRLNHAQMATDQLLNQDGVTVHRTYVRGGTAAHEVMHVWAFTT